MMSPEWEIVNIFSENRLKVFYTEPVKHVSVRVTPTAEFFANRTSRKSTRSLTDQNDGIKRVPAHFFSKIVRIFFYNRQMAL